MVTVLKLGGSVVTDKTAPETLDKAALSEASSAIGDAVRRADGRELVLVHGGGSFGHHHAEAHGVSDESGSHDIAAVADIHGAMNRLNAAVVSSLRDAGVPATPVHPFSLGHRDKTNRLSLPAGSVETLLAEGFTPVLHGDLVPHAGAGVTVLSGDEIVVELADELAADSVGLCSTVPGVLDRNGAVLEWIRSIEDAETHVGESDTTDVTGGMAGKVEALLGLAAPARIFDLDGLRGFLAGESPGTVIRSDGDRS